MSTQYMINPSVKSGVILTRFPYKSGWGGEEKLHLLLFSALKAQKTGALLWSGDREMLDQFARNGLMTRRLRTIRDITTPFSVLCFPYYALLLILKGIPLLRSQYRQGYRSILMLTLIDKITLTWIARMIGYQVHWGHHAPLGRWFFNNPLLPLWRQASRKCTTIITPSEAMRQEILKARPQCKVEVIGNPVALRPATVSDGRSFREQYKINENALVIGCSGRIAKEKNPLQFLLLAQKNPKLVFVMAGDGPLKKNIEQIINSKKITNVILTGFLTEHELPKFYAALDILVVLSDYETFCLAAAEALFCGIPVIAPRVGGIPEVVQHKHTGMLFRTGKFEVVNEVLMLLVNDTETRQTLAHNAQNTHNRFSVEAYLKQMFTTLC